MRGQGLAPFDAKSRVANQVILSPDLMFLNSHLVLDFYFAT
jgi:hypothetical protein